MVGWKQRCAWPTDVEDAPTTNSGGSASHSRVRPGAAGAGTGARLAKQHGDVVHRLFGLGHGIPDAVHDLVEICASLAAQNDLFAGAHRHAKVAVERLLRKAVAHSVRMIATQSLVRRALLAQYIGVDLEQNLRAGESGHDQPG